MLFDDAGTFWAPGYPLERVVDPTGAGDCFAGGLMAYLAHRGDKGPQALRQAMIFGSAVASFCVEDFSLKRFATVDLSSATERCRAFGELMRFEPVCVIG
jgi:fructose-1-phosphate kinase PfkB-like protein